MLSWSMRVAVLAVVLSCTAALNLKSSKPSTMFERVEANAASSVIHKGHNATFVTRLGSKLTTIHHASAAIDVSSGEYFTQYAHVSETQYDALRAHQHWVKERKAKNVSRVAFTALEDVFGSEYVGPIGVGNSALPASCLDTVSQLQQVGDAARSEDAACKVKAQQNVKAVFDTGSTNLWIASDLCESPCKESGRHWYDHTASVTYQKPPDDKYLRIQFGTASLEGPMAMDHFHIGPFAVKDQDFAMIEVAGGSTFTQMPLEGIVGLAFPAMSAAKGGRLPFFDNVIKQGLLEHNEFAFYFSKNHVSGGNAIFWGGVDPRAYNGDIHMFPVTQPFYWAIDLYAFKIGDKEMNLQGSLSEKQEEQPSYSPVPDSTMPKLIADTGTTYFTASGTLYEEIHERLPSGPCDETAKYPNIAYTLKDANGQKYELSIPPSEYMVSTSGSSHCRLAFMELYINERFGPAMLLGEVFMRHYFTVFDRGNGKPENARIGFGRSQHNEELNSMFGPGASGILSEHN